MKLLIIVFLISTLTPPIQMKSIASDDEPRIFFRQLIEASGIFPIELSVPDTISTMMNGLSAAYNAMSSFFGNGGDNNNAEGEEVQSQSEMNTITRDQRRKKVKRKKKINFNNFLKLYYLMS